MRMNIVHKTIEFLEECGTFFVLIVNKKFPTGRPFGIVMEQDNDLYITSANNKEVYSLLKQDSRIQIIALRNGTRNWAHKSGESEECYLIVLLYLSTFLH